MTSNVTPAGKLYIVSAASGAGKTSLVNALHELDNDIVVSVSHTTREPRPDEEDGVNYHFVSTDEFKTMIDESRFLEHAEVFGNHYGTTREAVDSERALGHDVILEIDWQGARQVREQAADAIGIFILPPSRAALEERLRNRGQDNDEIIAKRMAEAVSEMSHYDEFEFIVVNEVFNSALEDLESVIKTGQLAESIDEVDHEAMINELLA